MILAIAARHVLKEAQGEAIRQLRLEAMHDVTQRFASFRGKTRSLDDLTGMLA